LKKIFFKMQSSFCCYENLAESNFKYFDKIPYGWQSNHLKRFLKKITDGAHTSPDLSSSDYPFLTVVDLKDGKLDFENCLFTSTNDFMKLVRNGCKPLKDDVLYSKDGTISETVVININSDFVVGSSFIILRPNLKLIDPRYLSYFLSSSTMRNQAKIYIKGASLPRISISNVAKLGTVFPPKELQTNLSNFLDNSTSRINRRIDLLTNKLRLYEAFKKSLILETILFGLDKTVNLRSTGIAWAPEIPENWKMLRLKDVSRITKGSVFDFDSSSGHIPYLNGGINPSGYSEKSNMPAGVIAVSEGGASSGYVQFMQTAFWCGAHCYAVFPKTKSKRYLYFCLKAFEHVLMSLKTGSAMPNLRKSEISNLLIPITDNYQEQSTIADYLDIKTRKADIAINKISDQISRLKELRETLINDVVTGKIKVTQDDNNKGLAA